MPNRDRDGVTALYYAMYNANTAAVRKILSRGEISISTLMRTVTPDTLVAC